MTDVLDDTLAATDGGRTHAGPAASQASSMATLPQIGEIVTERYEIVSVLGSGGMGHVFEAKHTTLGRQVALKVLAPDRSGSPVHAERFLREAKSASVLIHPCVVEIIDFGHTDGGCPFFVMEYLEGQTLGARLRERGPLPWSSLAPIAMQICGALDAAHASGVIHRDIKPENLFILGQSNDVKVLDFGIAKATADKKRSKLTDALTVLGTADFISPEGIKGGTVDPRTDIYSLGVTLYQLLTGSLPFERSSSIEAMASRLYHPPAPLPDSVPAPVTALIMRMLRIEPEERFQTARELYDAIIESLPEHGPAVHDAISRAKLSGTTEFPPDDLLFSGSYPRTLSGTTPSLAETKPEPEPRSRRWLAWGGLAVVGGLAVASFLVFGRSHSSTIEPHRLASFGPLPEVITAPGVVLDDAKIELGRALFSDVRLSRAGDFSCATCHPLDRYGADGRPVSIGHTPKPTPRNIPSIYNMAGHFALGWTAKTATVEAQALLPIFSPYEMDNSEAQLVKTLSDDPEYRQMFARAFPGEHNPIDPDHVGVAIGAYERTLVTPAPWDDYLAGDTGALDATQRRGFNTFIDVGCVQCHSGVYLGAGQLQKLGLLRPWPYTEDRGRFEDTGQAADEMMFKIASLRNVVETAPYFHNGAVSELSEAVQMMGYHQLDHQLDDREIADIVAFLGSLTGRLPPSAAPPSSE